MKRVAGHLVFCALASVLGLFSIVGCGGGGGSGGQGEIPDTTLVSGTVHDSRNQPVSGASVVISSDPMTAVTDNEGAFFAAVVAGEHLLTISIDSHVIYSGTIVASGTGSLALGDLFPTSAYYTGGTTWYQDEDGDGYSTGRFLHGKFQEPGYSLGPDLISYYGDCADSDGGVHPGAIETCNGKDDDCDGSIDDIGCSPILLVDDDNGLNNGYGIVLEDHYPHANAPDVDHLYMADLEALDYSFDLFRVRGRRYGNGPDAQLLKKYETVIWFTGDSLFDSDNPATLTALDRSNLTSYLDSGGKLLLSGGEILWDMDKGLDGVVEETFAGDYLGVLTCDHDIASLGTTYGVPGDPVSDGLVIRGIDSDHDGFVDTIPTESQVDLYEWGHLNVSYAGSVATGLIFTPLSSNFAQTMFSGDYEIYSLTDEGLSFWNLSFHAFPDGAEHIYDGWFAPVEGFVNRYLGLLASDPGHYELYEYEVVKLHSYPDTLNAAGNPASADTLLVDTGGKAVALRVTGESFRTIFMAFPLEGLWPEEDRRTLLQGCLQWLGDQDGGSGQ